ncbi:MAG: Ig-like domain-containing protein [Chitinophagales bacterium]
MKSSFTNYIPVFVCFLLFFFLCDSTNLLGATIGDWIWADANNDGLLEAGEGGIGDIGVELFDNAGNLISTTQSNHDGYYSFKNLAAGTYTVAVIESMLVAPLTTPNSYTVTLTENEQFLTADFGMLTTFSTSNKPPVIITKNACTAPQTPVTICLEIFEPEGDETTITEGSTQTGATFTILNKDCFRYNPLPGYQGIDTISVTVCDDANPPRCVVGKIAISVPCPGGPLAVDDEVTTTQSMPVIIEVLANDNGQAPLEVVNVEDPPNGIITLVNNIVIYVPDAGFIGIDSFTYTITDISNQISSATVYVTVGETPIECELEMMECVEANTPMVLCPEYCEVEGSSLNVIEIVSEIGGELVGSPTEIGCYKYIPPSGFLGNDVVTILACNDEGNCAQTTINITIATSCSDAGNNIVAQDDFALAIKNTFIVINVLGNDFDPQGDNFSLQSFGQGINGAVNQVDNFLQYTPAPNFVGLDSFIYTICDVNGNCDNATVTIEVIGDGIQDCTSSASVCDNTTTATEVCVEFCNVSDAMITGLSSVFEATLNINSTSCFGYIPPSGFTGVDEVEVFGCNALGECDTILVTIEVKCPAPNANDDAGAAMVGQPLNLNVLENDAQTCDYTLSATLIGDAQMGSVSLQSNGDLSYTPNEGASGQEILTYLACNDCSQSLCDTAIVTITIGGMGNNQPPIAVDDNIVTQLNQLIGIGVLGNDSDPDGDNLTITAISSNPSNGTAVIVGFNNSSINYTPNFNFVGVDSFEYVICDPLGLCDTALVKVTVINVGGNLPPTAIDDNATTPSNAPITIEVLANDSDPEGGDLTISTISVIPSNGTVTIDGDVVNYSPNTGFTGTDSFEYVVCDTEGACDTALVTVTVTGVSENQPPIAVDDNATAAVNTPIGIPILANDSDPNGDPLTITTISANPSNGTVTIDNGTVVYIPNTDFIGIDNFEYTVCDPLGLCDVAVVTVTVIDAGDNQPPIAVDDAIVTQINQLIGIGVLGNDSDPDGDNLTITSISSNPSNGTVQIVGFNSSSINYTPNNNFVGTDTFEYVVCDPLGFCDTAQVVVTVINPGGNQPPIAIDDNATTGVNSPVSIDVVANDVDPDGDDLTLSTISSNPSNGTVTINNGTVVYTPNTDFIGTDSFEYTVCDPFGLCDVGLVVVVVNADGNQAPIAVDDNVITQINELIGIGVLTNDSDPDGDNIIVTAISSNPSNGTVTIVGNSSVNYTPNNGFVGMDSFEYVICDPASLCDTALVIVTVLGSDENQPPIAVDDAENIEANTGLAIDVLDNDSDPNGDEIVLTTISVLPQNGTANFNIDSSAIVYTPNTDFIGVDSFEYVICDSFGLCDTALVVVTITEADDNQAPIAVDDNATTTPNTPIDIPILDNDSDPDGDELAIITFSLQPSNGFVSINSEGTGIVYTPNEDFEGVDTLEYVICDPDGLCDTALVIITIVEPPFPIIADTTDEDTPLSICVEEFFDINFPIDSMTVFVLPINGTVLINNPLTLSDSCFIYTPTENFNGNDELLLGICNEAEGICDTITVNITVLPVNDAPTATDDLTNTDVNTPIVIPVLGNDFDIDGDSLAVITIEVNPSNGEATIDPEGTVTYTPDTDFVGIDTFVYVITDPDGLTDTALVIIGIGQEIGVIAVDDVDTTEMDTAIEILVLDNDLFGDFPIDSTVISITSNPSNGIVLVNGNGIKDTSVTYTPLPDFAGTDTFEYVVCVAELCDTATVVVVVTEVDLSCELFIPNAFSPNQDGFNDLLIIPNLGVCFPENELVIFNRWGDEVFRRQNYSDDEGFWDGTWQKNGEDVPDGTYFYILTGQDEEGVAVEPRSGFIEVCR